MREKLLFVGMLAMSFMYCLEVIPHGPYTTLNYIGFVIAAVTIIPWIISQVLAYKKWRRGREASKALREKERAARRAERSARHTAK